MQTYAVVVDSYKSKEKEQHILTTLTKTPEGELAMLKVFLKPNQIGKKEWDSVRTGQIVQLELSEVKDGYSSRVRVESAELVDDKIADLTIA